MTLFTDSALPQDKPNYLVLARKYRSQTFADLVGQEALVQTLSNAIASNRIHHAYILTGIRGVGKTSTARILAKALNCTNGPAVQWPDDDEQANSIAAGRHPDVLEYDAASYTGKDDVISLFEGVNYRPVMGQYKVYIIDEVHMLSKQAFNALLKTLEEPPPFVKFIFATTEIHKVPLTVLSRCQRFDLKRIPTDKLEAHFASILEKEQVAAEPAALQMIARAADGSARDGLSLLDQAIALGGGQNVTAEVVTNMLGLADRTRVFDVTEHLLRGNAKEAIDQLDQMHALGQDPVLLLNDLLALTHLLTRLKVVPGLAQSRNLTEVERTRAVPLSAAVPMGNLSRFYQLLLTAYEEAKRADRPHETVAMAFIRMAHLAPLPALETLMQQAPRLDAAVAAAAASAPAQPAAVPDPK